MKEKFKQTWFVLTVVSVVGVVAAKVLLGSPLWMTFALPVAALFIGALDCWPRVLGFLIGRRDTIVLMVAGLSLVGLTVAALVWFHASASSGPSISGLRPEADIVVGFLVSGVLAGILIDLSAGQLIYRTLCGSKATGTRVVFLGYWTLALILFGCSLSSGTGAEFAAGALVGVVLPPLGRHLSSRRASAGRRAQEVRVPRRGLPLEGVESDAVKLLVAGRQLDLKERRFRFKRLRRFIEDCQVRGEKTRLVELISAVAYRLDGEYHKSRDETMGADENVPTYEDAHLLLLRAINKAELDEVAEADDLLDRLLKRERGQQCPLARGFHALRLAESHLDGIFLNPDDGPKMPAAEAVTTTTQPIRGILRALDTRRRLALEDPGDGHGGLPHRQRFAARFSTVGIPVTASLFLDVLGICLLVAGRIDEGRLFLEKCISLDRRFSNAYHHLGFYFLLKGPVVNNLDLNGEELWHAAACFHAARSVEGNESSRIRRIAGKYLNRIEKAEEGN